jgi:hypothetical protein
MFIEGRLYCRTACDNIKKETLLREYKLKFKFTVIIFNRNLHEYLG